MTQDPLTLYKLIILYMLNRVAFPLTKAQIVDFVLEKEYTTFLTLQQAISDLTESHMVTTRTIGNRTQLYITDEGKSTLSFFENRISDAIKEDVSLYLKDHRLQIRNEISVTSSYYRSTGGDYEARLVAKERESNLITLTLSVPNEAMAAAICDNWQEKNQEIYEFVTKSLF